MVFYDNSLINTTQPVSVALKDVSIETLLSASLQGQGLSYSITDKTISIRKLPPIPRLLMPVAQQAVPLTGKVTDDAGAPLPGVTVLIKGTQTATMTDEKGEFKLPDVKDDATIVFSYIGFEKLGAAAERQAQAGHQDGVCRQYRAGRRGGGRLRLGEKKRPYRLQCLPCRETPSPSVRPPTFPPPCRAPCQA